MPTSPLAERSSIAATDPARAARLIASLRKSSSPHPFTPIHPDPQPDRAGPDKTARDERPPPSDRHPVRSNAVCVDRNPTIWLPIDRNERARVIFTATAVEKKTKPKGRADGAVGRSGLVILAVLLQFASYSASGRCDPSLETIAARARCCVQTVISALDRLAAIGLISVTRRWLRYRDPRTGVVHSRQITNAYHFAAATKRFWLPILAPINRSVIASNSRRLRRGGATFFKRLFQRQLAWEPNRNAELATPLFNEL